jgi:hypothetical protein
MSRVLMLAGTLSVLLAAWVIWQWGRHPAETAAPFEPPSRLVEPAPLCPWREPDQDLPRFFPESSRWETETRVLSGLRDQLSKTLGRAPGPEEIALTLHRVYRDSQPLGAVLVRRVKGRDGAIEVVVAVSEQGRILNVRLQRMRERTSIAKAVSGPEWLGRFEGRTETDGWGTDNLKGMPPEAQQSGEAIREGIRTLLVLLAASETPGVPTTRTPHH